MFALGRKFSLLFTYLLIATLVLICMPERLTGMEWLQVFLGSAVAYIASRYVVTQRGKKLVSITQVPLKKRSWKDKLASYKTPEFIAVAISVILISALWIAGKIDFSVWRDAGGAVLLAFCFGTASLKELQQEKV